MTTSTTRSSPSGFTLPELLIVIACIALLIALLLPVASSATQKSKATQCAANLRSLGAGTLAYAAEHNMELPMFRGNGAEAAFWMLLQDYVPHGGFGHKRPPYFCPENPYKVPPSGTLAWTNYAYNANFILTGAPITDPEYATKRKVARLPSLSGLKALYLDSLNPQTRVPWYATNGARYSNPWSDISPVHGDRINVVFTDGHVETPKVSNRTLNAQKDLGELKAIWFWPL